MRPSASTPPASTPADETLDRLAAFVHADDDSEALHEQVHRHGAACCCQLPGV